MKIVNCYLDDDGSTVVLHEQTDSGTRQKKIPGEFVTWHPNSELNKDSLRELKNAPIVSSVREVGSYTRVGWRGEFARRDGREWMKQSGITTLEGDVDPVLLYLVESKCEIAKPRRCYVDLEADSRVPLSRKDEMTIVSWALVDGETGEEFSGVLQGDEIDEQSDAEEILLRGLVDRLSKYDQIVVWEGDWKGGEFDSVVLPARCRKNGIDFDERRWLWLNQLAVWKRMNMHSAGSGAEKESFKLDVIAHEQIGEGKEEVPEFVRARFPEASKRGLGAMAYDLWKEGGEFRDLLVKYNVRDAALLRKLEAKKGYITIFQATCECCGIIPITRALHPTSQMDGFMLRLGRERDYRFPTKGWREDNEDEEEKQFRGAVVFHPKSVPGDESGPTKWLQSDADAWRRKHGFHNGIIRNVHVCDFTSLYPSAMRTWNLSAEVVAGWADDISSAKAKYGENVCWSPGTNLVTRIDVVGFLPLALAELIRLRKHWADLAASLEPGSPEWADAMAKSTAYKVIANSFYGAGGSKFSRFNNRDVSEATTQNCVYLLKLTAELAERRSMSIVYGDTDSNMVVGPTEEGFRRYVQWLNEKEFPKQAKRFNCIENHIKLAFEKTFDRVVFVRAKSYVGRFAQYKGTPAKRECHGEEFKHDQVCKQCGGKGKLAGDPEIKGLAYKRGDKGKFARELQGRVIDCLVGGVKVRAKDGSRVSINHDRNYDTPTEDLEVYREIVGKMQHHILEGELAVEDVRFSKALNKPLREYAKDATDAHVRIARILKERGQAVGNGTRIEYVVVDGTETPQVIIPAEDYAGECDRFHLWERVYQPTHDLLIAAFPEQVSEWNKWAEVRPKKGRKVKSDPNQLGFDLEPSPVLDRSSTLQELATPSYKSKPLVIEIPHAGGKEAVERVAAVIKRHPGARDIKIVFVSPTGLRSVVPLTLRASPSPAFREEIEEALKVAS